MKTELAIYYEPPLVSFVPDVCRRIESLFPTVHATPYLPLKVPETAWDTFRGQYDISYLLNFLMNPHNSDLVLWLIQGDIGDYWHAYLYGAALNHKAIVSSARIDTLEMVLKEACHEVGHLLGLSHCVGDCVMHTSRNESQVASKSNQLCTACHGYLEVANTLYK